MNFITKYTINYVVYSRDDVIDYIYENILSKLKDKYKNLTFKVDSEDKSVYNCSMNISVYGDLIQ